MRWRRHSAGIDALAFTGGIGEHAARVRLDICDRLRFLGVELDLNANDRDEAGIAAARATVGVYVIPAREDVIVSRAVRSLLSAP